MPDMKENAGHAPRTSSAYEIENPFPNPDIWFWPCHHQQLHSLLTFRTIRCHHAVTRFQPPGPGRVSLFTPLPSILPCDLSLTGNPSAPALAAEDSPSILPLPVTTHTYDHSVTGTTISAGPPPLPTTQTGCPTVTATRELCQTCPVPLCLGLATVTQSCGCPSAVPTVYLDFPCKDNCKGVWCSTSYSVVTATGSCTSAGPTKATTTPPPSGSGSQSHSTGGTNPTTSRPVVTGAAGRMAVPVWGGWF